jgi:putative Mn2+ efflux pump MntP
MKDAINILKKHRATVDNFLISTINLNHLEHCDENNVRSIYMLMPFLELTYQVDETFKQTSDYFYQNRTDSTMKGLTKSYLFDKVKVPNDGAFISNPYISSHTGNACITFVKKNATGYLVFDFNLFKLLHHIRLIETNTIFARFSQVLYMIIGFALVGYALALVGHACFTFFTSFVAQEVEEIGMIFTPIISLTLGLAIFDLAKTILEQEVFSKSYSTEENRENRIFGKFLISIIIALSIEALMVVFKIALSDYDKMINAFYLISGVALMILSLGLFHFLTKNTNYTKKPSANE